MTPRAGVVIGRWELTRLIAVGGMGQVWAAQEKPGGREVAVKVLRPEFAGERLFLDRIAAEARNSLNLVHPGIARTYAHGELDGLGYIVMELVPGEPLSTILARERVLARRLVLDIMAQTADALSAAHNAGVVHRDIKPANLILGPGGRVVLTDFGISLAANQAPMTAAGMVMGTAQYLPPEQAMGRAATGAGDLYALGIIAYESLVGKRPFTGATQVDIAFAHVTEPVPPLPETIDPRIRTLVEGLLEKEPTRRPAPAAHVAARARELATQIQPDGAWDISQPKSGSIVDDEPRRAGRRRRHATHAAGAGISDELDADVAPTITTGRPRPPQPRLPRQRETPSRAAAEAPTRRTVRAATSRRVAVAEPVGGVSEARSAHALLPDSAPPAISTPAWRPVHGSSSAASSEAAAHGPTAGRSAVGGSAEPRSARPRPDGPAVAQPGHPGGPPHVLSASAGGGSLTRGSATTTGGISPSQPTSAPRATATHRDAVTGPARSVPARRPAARMQQRPVWLLALVVILAAAVVTVAVLILWNLGQSGERADAWDQARTTIGEVQ